jgi:hypothetical protein
MLDEEETRLYTRALYGDRAVRTAARMIVRGAGKADGKQRCFAVILLSDFPMQDLNIDELWEGEIIFRPRVPGNTRGGTGPIRVVRGRAEVARETRG